MHAKLPRRMRPGIGVVVTVLTTVIVFAMPTPAVAAPAWSVVASPNISGVANQTIRSVSCISADFCVAVGHYGPVTIGKSRTLIEMWNGTTWSIAPSPATGPLGVLNGVSCASASFCFAVGKDTESAAPLIDVWDGTAWTRQNNPPEYGDNTLLSVACASPTACATVGFTEGNVRQTFVRMWNGHWYEPGSANNGAFDNQLESVSCGSPTSCTAVGSYSDGTKKHTLIESWQGTSFWTITPTQDVSTGDSALHGISCVSATSCMAVGEAAAGATTPTSTTIPSALAESWNGAAWIPTLAIPTLNNGDVLQSVSCTSKQSCTAAGYSITGGTLVEKWNGVVWLAQTTPNPSPIAGGTNYNHLWGVSCTPSAACTAVGDYYPGGNVSTLGVIEAAHGAHWAITASPQQPEAADELQDVSCSARNQCVAVGRYYDANGVPHSLIESWDGSAWTATPAPGFEMQGVSCVSATMCMAVGSRVTASWDGNSWTELADPSGGRLTSVSCASPTMCAAVSGGAQVEMWDGSTWSVAPTPAIPDAGLQNVSCATVQSCVAVGGRASTPNGYSQTLVESWDGSSWTVVPSPNTSGQWNDLRSVSCTSAAACAAVGYTGTSQAQPLIETFDGTSWTIQPAPTSGVLLDVSCAATDSCTAVGWSGSSSVIVSGGTTGWSLVPSPNPSVDQNVLLGVSCEATGSCMAVGRYQTAGGDLTLTERYA